MKSAGLSAEERKARDDDLAAKRAKKEEEKQRIMREAEADRKDRLQRNAATNASETPIVASSSSQSADVKSVKLQIRCPHFNQVAVFTSFTPDSSLSDCASALRRELIKGICQSDGLDEAAASARVPMEDTFVFVETVPPRKRWASSSDMQQTLRSAGLCPSSSLLAEVRPIEVPQALPEVGSQDCADEDHVDEELHEEMEQHAVEDDHESGSNDDEPDDEDEPDDDDGQSSGDDDDDFSWKGAGKGSLSKGKGFGKGGNWDYLPPQKRGHQFPEGGGQVLGRGDGNSAVGGAALASTSSSVTKQAEADTAEKQRAARDARLAALERRGLNSAAAADGKESLDRSDPKRAKGHMGDGLNKEQRAKERDDIIQRIQEDRESYELRKAHNGPAQSVAKRQEGEEETGVRLQVRCFTTRRVHIPIGMKKDSLLREVCESAAAALGIETPRVALDYPPFTEFTDEQLEASLSDLGLCPSATLRISSGAPAALTTESLSNNCPLGHPMTKFEQDGWCDKCKSTLTEGSLAWECKQCDFIICQECSKS